MMTPPPDEGEVVEIVKEGGATSENISDDIKYTDQVSDASTTRGWDELTLNEKCNRLGKWIGYIMNKIED